MVKFLSASLALNGILAFLLLLQHNRGNLQHPSPALTNAILEVPVISRSASDHHNIWSSLPWDKPANLAAALRSLNCPEPIVQNLVTAAINRSYATKQEDLRRIDDFWLDGEEKKREVNRRIVALCQLEKERERLITGVLDIPWSRAPFLDNRDDLGVFFGGMVQGTTTESVVDLFLESQLDAAITQALRQVDAGSQPPETTASLVRDFNQRLAQVLSPQEREEFAIRMFAFDYFDVWKETRRFGERLEPAQLREVLRILKPDEIVPPGVDIGTLKQEHTPEYVLAKEQQLRQTLGDERFAVFLQHQNGDISATPGWSDEGKPAPETFLQLFELKESILQRAEALKSDPGISQPERQNALEQLRAEAEQTSLSLVPREFYTNYLTGGGRWLLGLSPQSL